jgi:hypothetical protein
LFRIGHLRAFSFVPEFNKKGAQANVSYHARNSPTIFPARSSPVSCNEPGNQQLSFGKPRPTGPEYLIDRRSEMP